MLKTKPMLEAEVVRLRARVAELERAAEGRMGVIEDIETTMVLGLPGWIVDRIGTRWFTDEGEN